MFSTSDASDEQWSARMLSTPSPASGCARIKIFADNLEKFSYRPGCCELTSGVSFRQRDGEKSLRDSLFIIPLEI